MGRRSLAVSDGFVEDEIVVLLLLTGCRAGRRLEPAARAAAREQQWGSQHEQNRAHEDASLPWRQDGFTSSTAPALVCPSEPSSESQASAALRTFSGAVPPKLRRDRTELSTVRTSKILGVMSGSTA